MRPLTPPWASRCRPGFVADCLVCEEHAGGLLALQAARDWGVAPHILLGGTGPWTDADRIAVMGLALYERELCKECGRHTSICRNPKFSGWFEVEQETCFAKAAVDRVTGGKNFRPEPGRVMYPVLEDLRDDPAFVPDDV